MYLLARSCDYSPRQKGLKSMYGVIEDRYFYTILNRPYVAPDWSEEALI